MYREMIPVFVAAGHRVIAPDWFGFGRSDKPIEDSTYTFTFHRGSMLALINHLGLRNITLVCQDWGGVLGLTLPVELPDRFSRLFVMNTAFNTGDVNLGEGFLAWREYNSSKPDLNVGALIKRGTPSMTEAEARAYDAPYPDVSYKAGVRRFPLLVADRPDMDGCDVSRRARTFFQHQWRGVSFMAIGVQDPVIGVGPMIQLRRFVSGCPPPLLLEDAGHFVQEAGPAVAVAALQSFQEQEAELIGRGGLSQKNSGATIISRL